MPPTKEVMSCPSKFLRGLPFSEKKSLAGIVAVSLPADDLSDGIWSLTLLEDILEVLDLDKELTQGFYPITERARRGSPRPADERAAWEERVQPFRESLPEPGEPRTVVLRDLMVIVALRCGYDARTRVTFRRVCDAMRVDWHPRVSEVESTLARKVYERVAREKERELRADRWRGLKIGAAMIGGGTLLAVTGGLAAPALAAGIAASSSVIGASAAATLSGFATTAWMATLFGAGGAGLVGYKMDRRTKGVKEFEFESETSVGEEMSVSICVPGVLRDKADLQRGWGVEPRGPDVSAKERLRRFYYVYNRSKVNDVEDILVAYDGKESKLCRNLEDRYGADPRDPPTREALARAEGRSLEGVSQEDVARDAEAIEQLMEIVLQKEEEDKAKARAMAKEAEKRAKLRDKSGQKTPPQQQSAGPSSPAGSCGGTGRDPAPASPVASADRSRSPVSRSNRGDERKPSPSPSPSRSPSPSPAAVGQRSPSPPGAAGIAAAAPEAAGATATTTVAAEAEAAAENAAAAAAAAAAAVVDGRGTVPGAGVRSGAGPPPPGTNTAAAGGEGPVEGGDGTLLRDWDRGADGRIEAIGHESDGLPTRSAGAAGAGRKKNASDEIEFFEEAGGTTEEEDDKADSAKKEAKDLLKHRVWFWQDKLPHTDQYVLRWESDWLVTLGKSVETIIKSLSQSAMQETLKYTTLAAIMASLAWPLALISLSSVIDADWTIGRERADIAGKILADALLNREQGCRPVTLVGTSLGARLIFACLEEIARRHELWEEQMLGAGGGQDHWDGATDSAASSSSSSRSRMTRLKNAMTRDNKGKSKAGLNGVGLSGGKNSRSSGGGGGGGGNSGKSKKNEARCAAGVIENVCLLGAPVGASAARWERVARVVHGRIINGYSKSDVILGLVFRAKSLSLSVSGIQKVSAAGVENLDLSSLIGANHFNYNRKMPEILDLLDLDDCSKYIGRGDPQDNSSSAAPAPAASAESTPDAFNDVVFGATVVP